MWYTEPTFVERSRNISMPTFEAERGGLLWDATAVPNAFFCEYMPAAPDSHVKV